jgi:hypothetical protein
VGVGRSGDPDAPRLNERLDHLQAKHPFRYNLASGALIAGVLVLIGAPWWFAAAYAVSWAVVRTLLWRDGRILRRQYDARQVRVAAERAAKRRQR